MASDKVIGIDLGTTNSCVAIVEDGTPSVIPNRGGYKTTPSMVAIAENGKRLVGHIAKRQAITNAENTVYAAKRLIGRKWGSAAVRSSLEIMPYRIVEGPHDHVRLMLPSITFSVAEPSPSLLQEVKLIPAPRRRRFGGRGGGQSTWARKGPRRVMASRRTSSTIKARPKDNGSEKGN